MKLTAPLSTKTSKPGQEVTAVVVTPNKYKDWFVLGKVNSVFSSGSLNKKSELKFSFRTLVNSDGSVKLAVVANVTKFTNSKGVQDADEEGQIVAKKNNAAKAAAIGSLLGAGIGAVAGGGKGAAIGAAAGASAGLLFCSFGVKGPAISFDTGSQFELSVSTRAENAQ